MISILLFSLILLDFFTQVAIFLAILVVISTTVKPFYSPNNDYSVQFSSVTLLCLTLCNPMNHSMPAPESITNSWSLLKLMSIESVRAALGLRRAGAAGRPAGRAALLCEALDSRTRREEGEWG